jgi:hypothetical protein
VRRELVAPAELVELVMQLQEALVVLALQELLEVQHILGDL